MVRCPICNAENEDTERFCRDCGQKLPALGRSPAAPASSSAPPESAAPAGPFESSTVQPGPVESPAGARSGDTLSGQTGGLTVPQPAGAASAQTDTVPQEIACPQCGVMNDRTFRFCKGCGSLLSAMGEPAPPTFSEATEPENTPPPVAAEPVADRGPESQTGVQTQAEPIFPAANMVDGDVELTEAPTTGAAAGGGPENDLPAPGEAAAPSPAVRPEPQGEGWRTASSTPGPGAPGAAAGAQPVEEAAPPPAQASPAQSSPMQTTPVQTAPVPQAPVPQAPVQAPPAPPRPAPARAEAPAGTPIRCPSCGRPAVSGERFCSECGARLQPEAAAPAPQSLACPACSTPYGPDDKFCKSCGTRLPAASSPSAGPRLVLVNNGDEVVFPLDQPEVTIGRAHANDIAVSTDGYVSSYHARIVVEDGAAYVEDAGSTNGTFLRVRERTQLREGDEVKVGQSILRYHAGG